MKNSFSNLWKLEDYWANWTGFFLILVGMVVFLPRPPENLQANLDESKTKMKKESQRAPFRTLAWYEAHDAKIRLKAANQGFAKTIKKWTLKPHEWESNPLEAFYLSEESALEKGEKAAVAHAIADGKLHDLGIRALVTEVTAQDGDFKNPQLNDLAQRAVAKFRQQRRIGTTLAKKMKAKPYNQMGYLICWGACLALLFSVGIYFMTGQFFPFLKGFTFVFLLTVGAYFMAAQADVKALGIGYAAWAILLGLLVSNTLGTPSWVRPAVQTEYFIKTGLVLLGAEILFGKVLAIGLPGLFVAWVVTPIVLVGTYWFGQRVIKIPSKTLNITLSADMSVCGVSAAIATAAACRAKKEELTLAVGISMIFTSVMMIVMPQVIKAWGMDPVLGGAWMGGTIDATGAVAAAGAYLGEKALYVAATVKMIQNILIGVIAFAVAVYWVTRVERDPSGAKPDPLEIWYRFPKFVIGFVLASILFSLIYEGMGSDVGNVMITEGVIKGWTRIWRGWFFGLAFVSIGLATDFRSLAVHLKGGKPVLLYVCGQAFNLMLTLLVAYLMFYVVFPGMAAKL